MTNQLRKHWGASVIMLTAILATSGCGLADSSSAQSCVPLSSSVTITAAGLSTEQLQNAQIIAGVVASKGLPGWVGNFSNAVALHESDLHNLPGGDGSSVNFFQQTAIYGTLAQRMDPVWATTAFLFGTTATNGSHIPGLVDQPNWQSYANGDNWDKLAIAIQRPSISAYYSPTHNILTAIARAKQMVFSGSGTGASANTQFCATTSLGGNGSGGGFTTDTTVTYQGVDAALARAEQLANNASSLFNDPRACGGPTQCYRACDRIVAFVWGYGNSGYMTAYTHWLSMVKGGNAHADSRNVPVGALLFYSTTSSAGHVVVYLGDGKILSNDILDTRGGRQGGMYIVPVDTIEKKWGSHYLGWSPPLFAGAHL